MTLIQVKWTQWTQRQDWGYQERKNGGNRGKKERRTRTNVKLNWQREVNESKWYRAAVTKGSKGKNKSAKRRKNKKKKKKDRVFDYFVPSEITDDGWTITECTRVIFVHCWWFHVMSMSPQTFKWRWEVEWTRWEETKKKEEKER